MAEPQPHPASSAPASSPSPAAADAQAEQRPHKEKKAQQPKPKPKSETPTPPPPEEDDNSELRPWNAVGRVDYARLAQVVASEALTEDIVAKISAAAGGRAAHHWLRRGVVASQRGLEEVIEHRRSGKQVYVFTGCGPATEAMHFGQLLPLLFAKSEAFGCHVVVQISDDEKFLASPELSQADVHRFARENAKDIVALGFDPAKTFVFTNYSYMGTMYPLVVRVQKAVNVAQTRALFGYNDSKNIGYVSYPAAQMAPAFARCFPQIFPADVADDVRCIVPCLYDQDAFFRIARDAAAVLGLPKPAVMHLKFFPALQGDAVRAGALNPATSILLTDTAKQIKDKVNKYAFSGGRDTAEEQRRLGANVDVDVSYQCLRYLLEDDARLAQVEEDYRTGKMLTGEIKKILIDYLVDWVGRFQQARKAVTEETVDHFMRPHAAN
eukprot:m51a1_g12860 putative tryptophan--trna cytoplasmic-like isoform x1 (439) ;mRNA; f:694-2288